MSILSHYIRFHSVIKYADDFPTVANMQDAIALVRRYHIKSEIIGNWLYCFTSYLVGYQLVQNGFWFCKTHGAYIYSGEIPVKDPDGESLKQIRARLGSQKVLG